MKNDEWLKHLTDTLNENEICPHCKMDLKIRKSSMEGWMKLSENP